MAPHRCSYFTVIEQHGNFLLVDFLISDGDIVDKYARFAGYDLHMISLGWIANIG